MLPLKPSMAVDSQKNSFDVASSPIGALCRTHRSVAATASLPALPGRAKAVADGAKSLRRDLPMRRRKSRAQLSRLWLRRRRARGRVAGCCTLAVPVSVERAGHRAQHLCYPVPYVSLTCKLLDKLISLSRQYRTITLCGDSPERYKSSLPLTFIDSSIAVTRWVLSE